MRITHDQKEAAIEAIRVEGTMKAGAEAAGVTIKTLNNEMNRSAIFKKHILQAREEGKRNVADKAIELIKDYAYGRNTEKTDRNRLTAAIALANAFEAGFRGTSQVQGHIQHDVKILSAVPRPTYQIGEKKPRLLDNPPKKMLKSIRKVIRDGKGDYIGTQRETVEDVIEGEIVKSVGEGENE